MNSGIAFFFFYVHRAGMRQPLPRQNQSRTFLLSRYKLWHLGTMSHTVKSLCTRAGEADEKAFVIKLVLYALAAMMAWKGGLGAWKKAQPPKQRGFSPFYAVMCSQAEGVRMHSVQKVQGHRRWCTDV